MSNDDEVSQEYAEIEDGNESSNAAPEEEMVLENVYSSGGKNDDFKWTDKSARTLLLLKFEREDEFNRPSCRKIKLWEQISQEMMRNGYPVNGHSCDSKYRNLLATYRKNKIKQQTTGDDGGISWEFFELMDHYIGPKFCASTENFEYTLQPQQTVESDFEERFIFTKTPSKKAKLSQIPIHEERKMSIQEYFYEKMKFDRQCHREDSKRKSRKLELQEKKVKLREKQVELELKKVEALTALASAIAGLKSVVP